MQICAFQVFTGMVSIKDIAKAVGVSPSSVSFVLNGKAKEKRISGELAEKIKKAADRMGYRPNRVAIGLRTGKSKTIGLLVENISNAFFSSLAKTIEDEARKYGFNVVYCSTENDAARGSEMIQILSSQRVEGYLITPTKGMEPEIERLAKQNKPVVLMDRNLDNLSVPYVVVDCYSGMKEGMQYLIHKGYRKIGLVTIEMDLLQIREREKAYMDVLKENDIAFQSKNVLKLKFSGSEQESVRSISKFLKENKDLEVVVFSTNYLGIYGLESIKELGLQIPEQLKIMCFDDHEFFKLYSPEITVIAQPIEAIAQTAVNILISQMGYSKKDIPNTRVSLKTKFISRGSA